MGLESDASKVTAAVTADAATVSTFWSKYGVYVTHALALAIGAIVGHKL
jgi:hypothetical protein